MADNEKSKPTNNMTTTIIVAVIVAALAFFAGMQYQKSQVGSSAASQSGQGGQGGTFNGQRGGGGRAGGRGFGGATVGQILSVDANSITIKLRDGSSKIINLDSSTTISKTDTASQSDLKTGEMVAAFGMSNSDGSITAQNVQLNPMIRGKGMPGGQPSPTQ